MHSPDERFRKSEKLCSRKLITFLVNDGNILYSPLLKVYWKKSPAGLPSPAQIAFSVSRKGFAKAVHRNLIKRRMREAYRKNKQPFYDNLQSAGVCLIVLIAYRKNMIADYETIRKSIVEMLDRLSLLAGESVK